MQPRTTFGAERRALAHESSSAPACLMLVPPQYAARLRGGAEPALTPLMALAPVPRAGRHHDGSSCSHRHGRPLPRVRRVRARLREDLNMSLDLFVGAGATLGLAAYLFYVLARPERF